MSGIVGIIEFGGGEISDRQVKLMTKALVHRAPDGITQKRLGGAQFGFCKFSTTKEAVRQIQPLSNASNSLMLVIDGRLDNRAELISSLQRGYQISKYSSDAELVLAAFEHWGQGCIGRLNGDFALVIWDQKNRTALCARDHNGNRPFFYHWNGKVLTFASEPSALLAMDWIKKEPNEGYLVEYVANRWYSRTDTFWKNIYRIPPAHMMTIDSKSALKLTQHWKPDTTKKLPCKTVDEATEYYRSMIFDVVRRMSRSNSNVAFEVSGGLDSSGIFGVAAELNRQGNFPAPDIKAYTLNFRDDPNADELEYVSAMAGHTGIQVQEVLPTYKNIDWFRKTAEVTCDFPGYPNGTMAIGLRHKAREDGCRVVMTGVGGDEWTGLPLSGAYYVEALKCFDAKGFIGCLGYDIEKMGLARALKFMVRHGFIKYIPEGLKNLLRTPVPMQEPEWLSDDFREKIQERKIASGVVTASRNRYAQQFKVLNGAYNAIAREAEERLAARQSIEIRSPYFSKEFIQFAFSAQTWMLNRGDTNKWLHRYALTGIMPELVQNRTSKADFMNMFRSQIDELSDDFVADLLDRRSKWIHRQKILNLDKRDKDGQSDGTEGWIIWTLFGCDALMSANNRNRF